MDADAVNVKQLNGMETNITNYVTGEIGKVNPVLSNNSDLIKFIYVWIFENGVDFGPKLFRLPAGDSREGGPCGAPKVRGRGGGVPSWRVVVESLGAWLPAGTKGKAQQLSLRGWGESQRETFLLRETAYFLWRTAFVSHAL